MGILAKLLTGRLSRTRTNTFQDPFRIANPRIGFLNLQAVQGAALAEADRRVLSPLFKISLASTDLAPRCEVLLIYCTLGAEGRITGYPSSLRDTIKSAGAYIAIVASENPPAMYKDALKPSNGWHANIALVIDRKGDKFALFFRRLFELMLSGRSMPMAWNDLAPQIPGHDHSDMPGAMMIAETGHVTLDG
jgi:hypothetical protein